MKLSEQLDHEPTCNSVFLPKEEPTECDCYVSKVAQLEAHLNAELSAAKNDYARYKQLEAENEALEEELKILKAQCLGDVAEHMVSMGENETVKKLTGQLVLLDDKNAALKRKLQNVVDEFRLHIDENSDTAEWLDALLKGGEDETE